MNDTKHTPGPWAVEEVFEDGCFEIALDYEIPGAGNPVLVASTYHDEDDGDGYPISKKAAAANADLIAAAPELCAACVAAIEATGGSQHWNGWTKHFLVLVENALRKAGIDPATIKAKETIGPDANATKGE